MIFGTVSAAAAGTLPTVRYPAADMRTGEDIDGMTGAAATGSRSTEGADMGMASCLKGIPGQMMGGGTRMGQEGALQRPQVAEGIP